MSDMLNELKSLGVNVEEGMKRLMNNEALYVKMLGKFLDAVKNTNVMACFESGDLEAAVSKAHNLKGVTGNLSITPLYKGYTDVVALLRAGKPDEARAALEELLPTQEKIVECINNK